MTDRTPAVSMIVTTYNHEPYVVQCLDSIAGQTFRDFELVIMDDCSQDGTVALIESWLARTGKPAQLIVNQQNLGICATRNLALGHCHGTFISCVSGDDFYEPDKIERQYEYFRTLDDDVAAVFSNMTMIDESGRELYPWFGADEQVPEGDIFDLILRRNFIPSPAPMSRRSAISAVGGYDEALAYEDFDVWLKLADRFSFRYLPGPLVNYRVLATSLSRDPRRTAAIRETRARILAKWVGRDPQTDRVIRRRIWRIGLRTLPVDPAIGRSILELADSLHPESARRMLIRATTLPGAIPTVRAVLRLRDRFGTTARLAVGSD